MGRGWADRLRALEPMARSVAAATWAGALLGALVGGVVGRLAMRLLMLTSSDALRGVNAEDGETPSVTLQDPNAGEDALLHIDEARFCSAWTGEVILVKRDYSVRDEDQPFGLWLIVRNDRMEPSQ